MFVAECWKSGILYWAIPILVIIGVTFVTLLLLFLGAIRLYAKMTCGMFTDKTRMDGKTVIVTGSTSGIGKETAKELAKRGAKVIMACRNVEAANKIKDEIIEKSKDSKVLVKKLDLSSFDSIRQFAADINKTEKSIHVLIHNAGYGGSFTKHKSVDGLEITMATNHYGPFLLTHLLIDLLKKSAPSRIVVVASSLYRLASFNLDNPNPLTTLPAYLYYASKEANILFTRELARRLEGTGVTVNCLHPGIVDSGIWRNVPIPFSWFVQFVTKVFCKTPQEGCQTSVKLAVDESLNKVTGKYFSDCQISSLSTSVSSMEKAKKLWAISEKYAQLGEDDPRI